MLLGWELPEQLTVSTPPTADSLHIWSRKAAQRKLFALPTRHIQPVSHWEDGSTLSVY